VVKDGEVFIVDALTGRIMQGRRYSDGLHQAIEAKEKVKIQKESRTIATVTYQNFFNKYAKKSGMTGTGKTEEEEFINIYGMDIVEIPTNRPVLRIDKEDVVFRTKLDKLNAVCDAVIACRESKRPVLVGTTSVGDSEKLSQMFIERGIRHKVLNAKYHEKEAAIVADAGYRGAVTIATNMAGRGTDIKPDDKAKAAGGLLVIGTERYDSRRVDDQLRGRSGRQGDPGESRFYLSLEDDLFRSMDKKKLTALFEAHDPKEGEGASSPAFTKVIEKAQKRIEMDHFAQRKQVLEYDEVLNEQRETIYTWRAQLLKTADSHELITKLLKAAAEDMVNNAAAESEEKRRQIAVMAFADVLAPYAIAECRRCEMAKLADCIAEKLTERYECIEANYSDNSVLWERERQLLLKTTDEKWMEHIEMMKQLRQGIGLVSYAQRDPLVEYRIDAFRLFERMNMDIRYDTAMAILGIEGVKMRE
ncbi:MAG: preprotein translocase subunit SecA, partial [Oscillospiraceae bacterium]|nr:preprotein translocase subunit SecA [Oscillospiraceae bacterium]